MFASTSLMSICASPPLSRGGPESAPSTPLTLARDTDSPILLGQAVKAGNIGFNMNKGLIYLPRDLPTS